MDLELKNDKLGSSSGELNLSRGRSHQKKPWNNRGRSHSRDPNRGGKQGRGRSQSRGPKDSNGCFHCGKPGHFKRDCYLWKRNNKNKSDDQNSDANHGENYFSK